MESAQNELRALPYKIKHDPVSEREVHLELITIALLFALALRSLNANLFVIFFQSSQIFTGLAELALFHAFANIPMDKCSLAVHQVKLVVDAREHLSDGCRIADHAASAHHFGQISAWHHGRWLVVDATFEPSGAPVHKLDRTLCLDRRNRSVHILGHNVTAVHHAVRHVLSMARIALHEHRCWLKDAHCDLSHGELLMVGLLGGDDGCVTGKHEVNAWVRHKVGLKLCDIHIQGSIKAKRRGQAGDNLAKKTVQVGVCWSLPM